MTVVFPSPGVQCDMNSTANASVPTLQAPFRRDTFMAFMRFAMTPDGKQQDEEVLVMDSIADRVVTELSADADLETGLQYFVQVCSGRAHDHERFDRWGVAVLQRLHEAKTNPSFVDTMASLQQNVDIHGNIRPLLQDSFFDFITRNASQTETLYEAVLNQTRDLPDAPSIFGWKTLYGSYLMKSNGQVRERVSHLWFRVALFLHQDDWQAVERCFVSFRTGHFTHATPTLFYAGAHRPQMASCFTADTRVHTLDRGLVPISEVVLGDHVLTHKRRWRPVVQIHENDRQDRPMMAMVSSDRHVGTCTADHKFWVWNQKHHEPQWVDASTVYKNQQTMLPLQAQDAEFCVEDSLAQMEVEWMWLARAYILAWVQGVHYQYKFRQTPPYTLTLDGETVVCQVPNSASRVRKTVELQDKHFWHYLFNNATREEHLLTCMREWCVSGPVNVHCWITGWRLGKEVYKLSRPIVWINTRLQALMNALQSLHRQSNKLEFVVGGDIPAPDKVYTLGVSEDHSYTTAGGFIAKNCFLVGTEDSVTGIFKTLGDVAQISKWAGGLGIHISNIRANRSYIYGTNGHSNGILPMIRLYNDTSRYIDQCFYGTTPVFCASGWKPISDVQIGDEVLTTLGIFAPVHRVRTYFVQAERLLWQMDASGNVMAGVTTEHDMLVRFKSTGETEYASWSDMSPDDEVRFVKACHTVDYEHMDELFFQLLGYMIHARLNQSGAPLTWGGIVAFLQPGSKTDKKRGHEEDDIVIPDVLQADLPLAWIASNCSGPFPRALLFLPRRKLSWLKQYMPDAVWKVHPYAYKTVQYMLTMDGEGGKWTQVRHLDSPLQPWSSVSHDTKTRIPLDDNRRVMVFDLEVDPQSVNTHPTYQTQLGVAHNGGGKRNGAFAMYIEPWHADILSFLHAKKSTGSEEERARDLFYGLWIPDIFMRRVESDGTWSLMCPAQSKGLHETHGQEFDRLYEKYEREGKFVRQVPARELWVEIVRMQIETGTPYMLYKDTCNLLSNQKNLGTIRSSNLCTEIIEYSDDKEYAVCNLASIALPKCLVDNDAWTCTGVTAVAIVAPPQSLADKWLRAWIQETHPGCAVHSREDLVRHGEKWVTDYGPTEEVVYVHTNAGWARIGDCLAFAQQFLAPRFDFSVLSNNVRQLVHNLNKVIDKNVYPVPETERSNLRHRPIGIGVQGLADVFAILCMAFDEKSARRLNQRIFETMYFAALTASMELARAHGPYASFRDSPLSQGQFHFDLCPTFKTEYLSPSNDWKQLRGEIQAHGVRNSLLIAPMPTASTSQILGNNECFEPFTSNLYLRRTMTGEFYITNRHLRKDLLRMGLWNASTIQDLLVNKGSIQAWSHLPAFIRDIYRTVWEIPQKSLLDMACDRQFFVDQSQSLNLFLNAASLEKLSKMHFYAWKKGLKTGCYYVRSKPLVSSPQITVRRVESEETCLSCSA